MHKISKENTQLIHLFPKPVIRTNFYRPFDVEEVKYIKNLETQNGVANKSSINRRVLEDPILSDIKSYIQSLLDFWIEQIISPKNNDVKLQITQSWTNVTKPGGSHHSHYHPNSIVSGCIYFQAEHELDEIYFLDDIIHEWHIELKNPNEFNSLETHVPVKTGTIVLFPSNTRHGVPELQGNSARISVAFNSFYVGKLGFPDDKTNYLEINSIY
jgi:uncharacterized protein (TIGR02466 family)